MASALPVSMPDLEPEPEPKPARAAAAATPPGLALPLLPTAVWLPLYATPQSVERARRWVGGTVSTVAATAPPHALSARCITASGVGSGSGSNGGSICLTFDETVSNAAAHLIRAECTCDWSDILWCPHIVLALLEIERHRQPHAMADVSSQQPSPPPPLILNVGYATASAPAIAATATAAGADLKVPDRTPPAASNKRKRTPDLDSSASTPPGVGSVHYFESRASGLIDSSQFGARATAICAQWKSTGGLTQQVTAGFATLAGGGNQPQPQPQQPTTAAAASRSSPPPPPPLVSTDHRKRRRNNSTSAAATAAATALAPTPEPANNTHNTLNSGIRSVAECNAACDSMCESVYVLIAAATRLVGAGAGAAIPTAGDDRNRDRCVIDGVAALQSVVHACLNELYASTSTEELHFLFWNAELRERERMFWRHVSNAVRDVFLTRHVTSEQRFALAAIVEHWRDCGTNPQVTLPAGSPQSASPQTPASASATNNTSRRAAVLNDIWTIPLIAARMGWTDERIVAVTSGRSTAAASLPAEPLEIQLRRIDVLTAQHDFETCLRYATVTGHRTVAAMMLARLGRLDDAMQLANSPLAASSGVRVISGDVQTLEFAGILAQFGSVGASKVFDLLESRIADFPRPHAWSSTVPTPLFNALSLLVRLASTPDQFAALSTLIPRHFFLRAGDVLELIRPLSHPPASTPAKAVALSKSTCFGIAAALIANYHRLPASTTSAVIFGTSSASAASNSAAASGSATAAAGSVNTRLVSETELGWLAEVSAVAGGGAVDTFLSLLLQFANPPASNDGEEAAGSLAAARMYVPWTPFGVWVAAHKLTRAMIAADASDTKTGPVAPVIVPKSEPAAATTAAASAADTVPRRFPAHLFRPHAAILSRLIIHILRGLDNGRGLTSEMGEWMVDTCVAMTAVSGDTTPSDSKPDLKSNDSAPVSVDFLSSIISFAKDGCSTANDVPFLWSFANQLAARRQFAQSLNVGAQLLTLAVNQRRNGAANLSDGGGVSYSACACMDCYSVNTFLFDSFATEFELPCAGDAAINHLKTILAAGTFTAPASTQPFRLQVTTPNRANGGGGGGTGSDTPRTIRVVKVSNAPRAPPPAAPASVPAVITAADVCQLLPARMIGWAIASDQHSQQAGIVSPPGASRNGARVKPPKIETPNSTSAPASSAATVTPSPVAPLPPPATATAVEGSAGVDAPAPEPEPDAEAAVDLSGFVCSAAGCGEGATLGPCPVCTSLGLPDLYYCSQSHFMSAWPYHVAIHENPALVQAQTQPRPESTSTGEVATAAAASCFAVTFTELMTAAANAAPSGFDAAIVYSLADALRQMSGPQPAAVRLSDTDRLTASDFSAAVSRILFPPASTAAAPFSSQLPALTRETTGEWSFRLLQFALIEFALPPPPTVGSDAKAAAAVPAPHAPFRVYSESAISDWMSAISARSVRGVSLSDSIPPLGVLCYLTRPTRDTFNSIKQIAFTSGSGGGDLWLGTLAALTRYVCATVRAIAANTVTAASAATAATTAAAVVALPLLPFGDLLPTLELLIHEAALPVIDLIATTLVPFAFTKSDPRFVPFVRALVQWTAGSDSKSAAAALAVSPTAESQPQQLRIAILDRLWPSILSIQQTAIRAAATESGITEILRSASNLPARFHVSWTAYRVGTDLHRAAAEKYDALIRASNALAKNATEYARFCAVLNDARVVFERAGMHAKWDELLAAIRAHHRARPSLVQLIQSGVALRAWRDRRHDAATEIEAATAAAAASRAGNNKPHTGAALSISPAAFCLPVPPPIHHSMHD